MGQVAQPIADDFDSGWTPSPVYPQVNARQQSDATWVRSSATPQGDAFQVQLHGLARPDPTAPASATALYVRVRDTSAGSSSSSSSAGGAGPVTVVLLQGDGTVIALRSVQPAGAFANVFQPPLTAAEIGRITDYADLDVRVIAGNPVVSCCPSAVPALLYGTFSGGTGGCTGLDGLTVPFVWDPSRGQWLSGTASAGGLVVQSMALACGPYNGQFLWNVLGSAFGENATTAVCDPFQLTFANIPVGGTPCTGTVTLTITP